MIADFYQSGLGRMAADYIWEALLPLLPPAAAEQRTLVIGDGAALADRLLAKGGGTVVLAQLGDSPPVLWPQAKGHQVVQVAADALPFGDVVFDWVVVLHGLEFAPLPEALMAEINRVLVTDGRVVVVAPNRWGLWQWFSHTPWGDGRSFSPLQLRRLLQRAQLEIHRVSTALFMPPVDAARYGFTAALARGLEKAARYFALGCGGVVVGAARKLRYAPAVGGGRGARARVRLALATNPAQRNEHEDV